MPRCPWEGMLPFIGSDGLDDATYAVIERHVESCEICKLALEELVRGLTDRPVLPPGSDRLPRIPGFEIQHELGRGAMGVVYMATQTGLDRKVALKVLASAVGPDGIPTVRRRWLREARAVSSIRHPGVVPLFEYGEEDGWFFLVLEYIPGGSLKKRLAEPLPPRVAAGLVETIARAVGHIHSRGMLHLDLKPSNILLDCEDHASWDRVIPRVSDFGLAVFNDADLSEASLAGARGTPSYMAPEQTGATPSKVGPAADIYALGAVLYELLTGRPPFQGTSTIETLDQVRGQDPVPPRRLNPAIPRDLEIICLTCLRKDPVRRYGSAEALTEDLRRWLDGRPILARPLSSFAKAWRWCGRRPAVAALIAALALTLVSGFVGVFVLWRLSEAERARTESARQLAEENATFASSALNEVNHALIFALSETLSEERMLATAYSLRKQASHLKNYRGLNPRSLHGLGVVEHLLAARLLTHGKREEARALLIDSVAILGECRLLDLGDESILWQLTRSLLLSGGLAVQDSAFDEALAFYDQASSLLGSLRTVSYRVELINELYWARRNVADQLTRRGDAVRARRAFEANLRMFDSMANTLADQPELTCLKELTLADLSPDDSAIVRLQSTVRRFPEGHYLRNEVERRITGWLTVNPFSESTMASSLTGSTHDPEAWAEALVGLIRTRCSAQGLDAAAVPTLGFKLMDFAGSTSAEQRHIGRLADAERTAARLMGFARWLVQNYPVQPESHMVLSEAHFQVSKNAWAREDHAAVEQALRQALESARHAVSLSPQREDARRLVDRILPRLVVFDAGRAKPE
jgi:eukaryotic-like serine/threonine-protein kinase